MSDNKEAFYDRADAMIKLANEQISEGVSRGHVCDSFIYGLSRYSAWMSATAWNSSEELANAKEDTIKYFMSQYLKMLDENIEDYIKNYDTYMSNT